MVSELLDVNVKLASQILYRGVWGMDKGDAMLVDNHVANQGM